MRRPTRPAPHARAPGIAVAVLLSLAHGRTPLSAQIPGGSEGWEFGAIPSLGFDSDEGFQYGAIIEAYNYGADGAARPYIVTVQPALKLSTEGRRDVTVFMDGPHMLPGDWRLTVFGGFQRHTATPYYGLGNDAEYDEALDRGGGPDPYYYRFGRTRNELTFDLQAPLPETPLRLLFGGGVAKVTIDPTPHNEGTTVLAGEFENSGHPLPRGWTNFLRGGIVWDTRDREVGPTEGVWSELLVKRAAKSLAGDYSFTRWTLTDRRYYSLADGLVLANRFVLQGTHGDAPFYELQYLESSFKREEALGGGKSIRGVLKNRFTGKGLFLWNVELRYRAWEFSAFSRDFYLVTSAFVDSGRVWAGGLDPADIPSDLHAGFGGGLRLGMGENFVVALDLGHSVESTASVYLGLGYLY